MHRNRRSLNEGELGYDYKVRYIDWDVDTEEELEDLPTEVIVNVPEEVVAADMEEEYISDYLSDEYGFCHNGFLYSPVGEDEEDFEESFRRPGCMLKESEEKIELNVSKDDFLKVYWTITDVVKILDDISGLDTSFMEPAKRMAQLMKKSDENGLDNIFSKVNGQPKSSIDKAVFYLTMKHFKML